MAISHIDNLVNFKHKAVNALRENQSLMALVSNDPSLDLESDDVEMWDEKIVDYDYVDSITVSDGAYVMVETELSSLDTNTINTVVVYVQVVCSKGYMELDSKRFKGLRGNRRDNIARQCDAVLNQDIGYGVGALRLISLNVASVPDGFTSVLLTYKVPSIEWL